jgi:hypothetical protein
LKKEDRKAVLRRTYKSIVQLDEGSLEKILFLSRVLVHLWNLAHEEAERWLKEKEKAVSAYSFNYWLTIARQESITLEDGAVVALADVGSDMEREILRKLAGSYQSFFELKKNKDNRAKKPAEKQESWFQTMSWSSFKIVDGTLIVPGYRRESIRISLKGRDKRSYEFTSDYLQERIAGKEVSFVTLSRNREGAFELSLVVVEPLAAKAQNPVVFRVIDLGAGNIAVMDWDESANIGKRYLIPTRRPDKMWMDRIAMVEGRQKGRTKGSRGWKRLAEARRYMHNRSGQQKDDHQKKVAHALVKDVGCVIVGKGLTRLGLAKTKNGTSKQHYGAQNTGYLFRQLIYLRNKAEERGINLIELPDPQREGALDDPESKFRATLKLLQEGYRRLGRSGAPADMAQFALPPESFVINFGG